METIIKISFFVWKIIYWIVCIIFIIIYNNNIWLAVKLGFVAWVLMGILVQVLLLLNNDGWFWEL